MGKFKGLLIFTSGLAVGSVVTATLLKKYYEEVTQAEIDSVKEIFTYRKTETGEPVEEEHSDVNNEIASSIAKAAKEKKILQTIRSIINQSRKWKMETRKKTCQNQTILMRNYHM